MHPVGRNLVAAQALLMLLLCSLADALGSPARVDSLQCHVCGGASSGPDPPPPCRPGVLPPPRPCLPRYVGCLTTFDGTSLIRTCGDWAHEDCQMANGVGYCYCHGRLCNTHEPKDFRKWFPSVDQYDDDNDDEDDNEDDDTAELGSGDFDNDGSFTRSVSAGSSSTTWPTSTRGATSTTSAGSTTSTSTTTSTTTSRTTTPITSTPGMRAPSTVSSDGDLFIGGSSSSRESTETTNSTDSEVLVSVKKSVSAASGVSSSLWVLTLAGVNVAIRYRPRNDR